ERLRVRLMKRSGPDGLEAAYAKRLDAKDATKGAPYYAAMASVAAADAHRRATRYDAAVAALGRALVGFEKAREAMPGWKESVDGGMGLGVAGGGGREV